MTEETYLGVRLVTAPDHGVWRLGKAKKPLKYNKIAAGDTDRSSGNRWSLVGHGTLYCASDIEGCFAEALEHFRVDPELRAVIKEDWREPYFMPPGTLPLDWRTRHTLVRLQPDKKARFLDVDDGATLASLSENLQPELKALDVDKLTHEHIQGADRRVTRRIAAWAIAQRTPQQAQLIHGVAYGSRFASRRCWAIFSGCDLQQVETQPVWPETEGLSTVAAHYGLTIR
ncbi:RES family NAD+ phosphorylase [Streptomyces sp. NPDC058678]|uniref:RES family NAD+ phosphorylase n=1 Tax=Streptomyces sp. NPDC058678 TaxID=3346595 RepID=UPI003648C932